MPTGAFEAKDIEPRITYGTNPGMGIGITESIPTLDDFSSGAVCLVLASEVYEPEDYIYDYEEFLKYKGVKD